MFRNLCLRDIDLSYCECETEICVVFKCLLKFYVGVTKTILKKDLPCRCNQAETIFAYPMIRVSHYEEFTHLGSGEKEKEREVILSNLHEHGNRYSTIETALF